MAKAGNKLDIIFEDEYMIACVKPYGVSVQPDNGDGEDLMTAVKNYLYDGASEEEPYLAVINRFDKPVSGIVLYAKTEEMAASLADLLQSDEMSKYYQAVVTGFMDEPEGTLTDWMIFDKKTNTSKIVTPDTKGAKKAELNYEVLASQYRQRKDHKLDCWHQYCDWIRSLPYSEFITMEE